MCFYKSVNFMKIKSRDEINEDIFQEQELESRPSMKGFLTRRNNNKDITKGSWEFMSYELEYAFEELWDIARLGRRMDNPLLFLWRHSVELSIKSALNYVARGLPKNLNHDIITLFDKLVESTEELGLSCDDDITREVASLIKEFASFDRYADRYRYPTSRDGKPHDGIAIDLEMLFKSHSLILSWCGGTHVEVETGRINGLCK